MVRAYVTLHPDCPRNKVSNGLACEEKKRSSLIFSKRFHSHNVATDTFRRLGIEEVITDVHATEYATQNGFTG